MSDSRILETQPINEPNEAFDEILAQYEQSHSRETENGGRQLEGTVVTISAESVGWGSGVLESDMRCYCLTVA